MKKLIAKAFLTSIVLGFFGMLSFAVYRDMGWHGLFQLYGIVGLFFGIIGGAIWSIETLMD